MWRAGCLANFASHSIFIHRKPCSKSYVSSNKNQLKHEIQSTRNTQQGYRKTLRDIKHNLTKTKAEKTRTTEVGEEQRGEQQNDGLWRRNTYYFFLRLAGFLVIFFLKAGTSRCTLFVDDDSSRGLRNPSFSGCDTPF
jgi:hypothetical protein